MAEKYVKVKKEEEKLPSNLIRVRKNQRLGNYLRRAIEVLVTSNEDSVKVTGLDKAIEVVVQVAELIKHKVKGLYQLNTIQTLTIVDDYEPIEEGLDHLTFSRNSLMLVIELSKTPLDNSNVGY
jgi:DNA-binding protein